MTAADLLRIEYHDGEVDEFADVTYTLTRDLVRVVGSDGAELVLAAFDVADVQAVRRG